MKNEISLRVRYRSSPNIAWVKYWGKYDEQYILPINDSLGVTLNSDDIFTQTQITFSSSLQKHSIVINKTPYPISKRIDKMLTYIKQIAFEKQYKNKLTPQQWQKYYFSIDSFNSFPTASGMASSASGLACLAVALNGIFNNILSSQEVSQLARLGSGSASRSVCGGLVHWVGVPKQILDVKAQKSKSTLQQLSKQCISYTSVSHEKLKDFKVLILLANNKQKQISSTSGMSTSVDTSELIKYRNELANRRISKIKQCIERMEESEDEQKKVAQFNIVVENIIKDSNQFHAICLDTYPPIFYLNQFSKQIITIVDHYLNPVLKHKVAYTFDAGPHAFLFLHHSIESSLVGYFYRLFQLDLNQLNLRAKQIIQCEKTAQMQFIKIRGYEGNIIKPYSFWSTSIGCGAYKIE